MVFMSMLISQITDAEDRAFMDRLYRTYYRYMLGVANAYVADWEQKKDIVSESLLSLMQRIPTLRSMNEDALKRYIVLTVKHTAINFLKKDARRRQHFTYWNESQIENTPGVQNPERDYMLAEDVRRVNRIICSLTEKEQMAVHALIDLELSYEEASKILETSVDTLRHTISRARKKILAQLHREGGEKNER